MFLALISISALGLEAQILVFLLGVINEKLKSDFIFYVTQKLSSYKALHQWVACPETGDIVVSFSDDVNDTACENLVHYFKMSELFEVEPP